MRTMTQAHAVRRLACALLLGAVVLAQAAAAAGAPPEKLTVALKKSLLLELGLPVETVSITDTEIADFVVAAKTQVLIHGKKEGITSLVVWTQGGTHRAYDLVVNRGAAPKQVQLNVRVAEVNNTKLTEYGIDYLIRMFEGPLDDRAAGLYPGNIGKPAIPLAAGSLPEYPDDAEIVLSWIKGSEQYEMILHALQQKGFVNVLARPNLICVDGKEASFLAGGEIPVPVAQTSSAGGTTVTVEWREFGTRLNFMPTIVDSNLIHLRVEPEVSILDYTNAVVIGGYVVPALRTRRAETEVELRENESFVIGGLQSQSERKIEDKVPIIGDIPLLGYLFRSVSKQMETSELMIVVSPQIVRPLKTNEVPELPCKDLPPLPCDKSGDKG